MRIAALSRAGKPVLAVRRGDAYVDLSVAAPQLPGSIRAVLEGGRSALAAVEQAAKAAAPAALIPLSEAVHLPPISDAQKVICLGLNYVDHASESPYDRPDYPVLFTRFATSYVGANQPLIASSLSERFDYEGELVAVIGTTARKVAKASALTHVAGYSIFNDGSYRDYQMRTPQWTVGKNFDASGSFGPEFVTADELPPGAAGLRLQTRLNGHVMQDATTTDMIFDVATTIEIVSQVITLLPGDVLVMGTPAGVGFARKPPVFMKAGDHVEIEIEAIGVLANPVVAEVGARTAVAP